MASRSVSPFQRAKEAKAARARKPADPPPKPPPDPRALARAALEAFWGRSNGGASAYDLLEHALTNLKLGQPLLAKLRRNLPVTASGGTTAQRIETCRHLLDDLAEST